MLKNKLGGFLLIGGLALGLAGCNGDDEDDGGGSSATATATATASSVDAAPADPPQMNVIRTTNGVARPIPGNS